MVLSTRPSILYLFTCAGLGTVSSPGGSPSQLEVFSWHRLPKAWTTRILILYPNYYSKWKRCKLQIEILNVFKGYVCNWALACTMLCPHRTECLPKAQGPAWLTSCSFQPKRQIPKPSDPAGVVAAAAPSRRRACAHTQCCVPHSRALSLKRWVHDRGLEKCSK
jgi:hypothetical protein